MRSGSNRKQTKKVNENKTNRGEETLAKEETNKEFARFHFLHIDITMLFHFRTVRERFHFYYLFLLALRLSSIGLVEIANVNCTETMSVETL